MTTPQENSTPSLSNRNYEEKRDFIRMEINANAIITDDNGVQKKGLCLNLSGSGALLELEENLPVNQFIGVTIRSPGVSGPTLDIKGHVIRGQAAHESGKYLIAMCYRRSIQH